MNKQNHFKILIMFLLAFALITPINAAIVSHSPAEVVPGTFASGNYTFPDSLFVTDNVGIGTTSPNANLHVTGPILSEGGSYTARSGTGSDSSPSAALVIDRGSRIMFEYDGYLRNIIDVDSSSNIDIGQYGSSLISSINLMTGSAGYATIGSGGSETMRVTGGDVGIGTTSPSSKLHIANVGDTVADDTGFGIIIDHDMSGADVLTADRNHAGLYIDVDSSATGGDTTNEHRVYGIYNDVLVTGDSDLTYASYNNVRTTHTSGSVSALVGLYGLAQADNNVGTTTNVYGGQFLGYEENAGTRTNVYGSYSRAQKQASATTATNTHAGVYGEVQSENGAGAITNGYGVRAIIDNDNTGLGAAAIGTGILFYGDYQGTIPTNAYGIYIGSSVDNYFAGNVAIGTTNPDSSSKLHVSGNILAASTASGTSTVRNSGVHVWSDQGFGMELHSGQTGHSSGWATAVYGRSTESTALRFGSYPGSSTQQADFSEYMTIMNTGDVGIGTVTPGYKLDVNGTGRFTGALTAATINAGAVTLSDRLYKNSGTNLHLDAYSTGATYINYFAGTGGVQFCDGANTCSASIGPGGVLTASTTYINGNLYVTTSWAFATFNSNTGGDAGIALHESGSHRWSIFNQASTDRLSISDADHNAGVYLNQNGQSWVGWSDARFKNNVSEISGALDSLDSFRGVRYRFKNNSNYDIGVIAQEINNSYPELVSADDKGYLGVTYDRIGPILVEAVKELKSEKDFEINNLTAEIDLLKDENQGLKKDNTLLKQALCEEFPEKNICHS